MGATAIEAGKAFLKLLVDNKEFKSGLDAGLKQLDSFAKSAMKVGAGLTALGGTITAPFIASLKIFADVGSELEHMSERTGVSVRALSELKFAAEQSGTNLEGLEGTLRKMQKALGEAEQGSGEASEKFAKLGLSVAELSRLSPDKQFEKVSAAIADIHDPTQRAAAAISIFGKSGTSVLPMIENLSKLQAKARELGVTMSGSAAESANKLHQAFNALTLQGEAVAVAIGQAIAPAVVYLVDKLEKSVKSIIAYVHQHETLVRVVAVVGAGLLSVGTVVLALSSGVRAATAAVRAFKTALVALEKNPWVLVITLALTALAYVLSPFIDKYLGLVDASEKAEEATNELAEANRRFGETVEDGTQKINLQTEAIQKLHAAQEKAAHDAAVDLEVDRQKQRENILGTRPFEGSRGRNLNVQQVQRELKVARDALKDIQDRVSTSPRLRSGELVDVTLERELLDTRKKVAALETRLKLLTANPIDNTGLPTQVRLGNGPVPFFSPQLFGAFSGLGGLAPALIAERAVKDFQQSQGRRDRGGLAGLDTVPAWVIDEITHRPKLVQKDATEAQKAFFDLIDKARPVLTATGNRLDRQIFGGQSGGASRLERGVERLISDGQKNRQSLENIDRNTARATQFTAGNV